LRSKFFAKLGDRLTHMASPYVSARSEVFLAAGSSNGRTAAFEAVNLGSIPSPAAKYISLPRSMIGHRPFEGEYRGSNPCPPALQKIRILRIH
jgi:hypothetical protein